MIVAIPDDNSVIKWKKNDNEGWKSAEISDLINAYEGRRKGKWVDRMTDKGYVECPFCHKQITGGDLNFCVKCGAYMRG